MLSYVSRRLVVTVTLATLTGVLFGAGPAASHVPAGEPGGVAGQIRYADEPDAVPDSYVVVLNENTAPDAPARLARELTEKYGGTAGFIYDAALQGFSVKASADQARMIAGDAQVDYVAQDQYFTTDALGVQFGPPSWGIDRIDERSLPLDNKYHYPNVANTVTAYVIDTGILLTHQEFGGRAFCGFDPFLGGCAPCNQGHGTHVAGTIGGRSVGVAKGVRIISVRVFGCSSSTTAAVVIAGVNFVTLSQSLNPAQRSVANMSLSGGAYVPLDTAVTNSIATNVHYSVAAGNSNADACLFSPARVPRATTVGATTITDNRAAFSNVGACVDLFAPGQGITSAWHTANNAYNVLNGTSMASPHAAGTAALWRHRFPVDNADQVATALNANATPGVVIGPGAGSPNRLLFMGMVPV